MTEQDPTLGIRPGAMGAAWRELMDEAWWGRKPGYPGPPCKHGELGPCPLCNAERPIDD